VAVTLEEGCTIAQRKKVRGRCFLYMLSIVNRSKLGPGKLRLIGGILLITVLLVTLLSVEGLTRKKVDTPNIFVGMDIGYGDEKVALKLIDKFANYVNLIILGSLDVTKDTAALTRVCDHMYQKNLHFIVYVGFAKEGYTPPQGPDSQFFTLAVNRWGDKFLGVYLFDEVGGKLIDRAHSINVTDAENYSEAAILYTHHLNYFLGNVTDYYDPAKFRLFTSDYALYWYDYLSGYDVVFTEFVGNQSREIAAGLCRGAAKTLNKDWGVIITWSNQLEPFVENPDQLYKDMILAYQNGAKYIVVFNSPGKFSPPTEYGTLTLEHLDAMKMFWNYVNTMPPVEQYHANTAYVLPRDYGYGFRGINEKIWGLWEADALSLQLLSDLDNLMAKYVLHLDVVYETKSGDAPINFPYNKLIFWNGTIREK
jgi:hypothetical protein